MNKLIAKIQIGRKELRLDDLGYYKLLFTVTGKSSASLLNRPEAIAVVKEMERRGFKGRPATASTATGKYAPILKALWLSAYNLGIARSQDDKALLSFVQRQTGVTHTRFLTDEADARKAIEGMKKWLARDGGVEWPGRGHLEAKRAVVIAQWRKLVALGSVKLNNASDPLDGLGEYVAKLTRLHGRCIGDIQDATITAEELDKAQAALGRRIRSVQAKREAA